MYLWEVSILLAVILATGRVSHLSQEGGGQQEEEAGVLHPDCGEEWGGAGGSFLYLEVGRSGEEQEGKVLIASWLAR